MTMTRFALLLATCFLSLSLADQAAWSALNRDEASGFRGNRWGAAPNECASLRFAGDLGSNESGQRITLYDRSTVGITMNGTSFNRIRYRFVDNQLESVQLSYEGRANRDKLLEVIEERYGQPHPGERKNLSRIEWDGEETIVNLDYRTDLEQGSLWFISTDLNRQFFG
ncbi:MAG TPA: hypothetical protein VF879_06640 [Nitrospirales bacterium]